jgi:hypothetical protein
MKLRDMPVGALFYDIDGDVNLKVYEGKVVCLGGTNMDEPFVRGDWFYDDCKDDVFELVMDPVTLENDSFEKVQEDDDE